MLLIVAVIFICWWTLLYVLQDRIIFPRDVARQAPATFFAKDAVDLGIRLNDAEHVEAWLIHPPDRKRDESGPVVMFFHGNAELIDHQYIMVKKYHEMGISVVLLEYRGYGRSGGLPSLQGIRDDSIAVYDRLKDQEGIDPGMIMFHGRSLGGGIAANLASARTPALLIIESSFLSAAKIAHTYAAPGFLVKHPYNTERIIAKLNRPTLIFHGTHDTIVPVEHGRELAKLARDGTYLEFPCGHNDFPGIGSVNDYWEQVHAFLAKNGFIPAGSP